MAFQSKAHSLKLENTRSYVEPTDLCESRMKKSLSTGSSKPPRSEAPYSALSFSAILFAVLVLPTAPIRCGGAKALPSSLSGGLPSFHRSECRPVCRRIRGGFSLVRYLPTRLSRRARSWHSTRPSLSRRAFPRLAVRIAVPSARASPTGTAFPSWRYLLAVPPTTAQPAGKPWMRAYSGMLRGRSSSGWQSEVAFWSGSVFRVGQG